MWNVFMWSVCVYVCVCMCCVCVSAFVWMHCTLRACAYVCLCICVCAHVCAHVCGALLVLCVSMCVSVCVCVCVRASPGVLLVLLSKLWIKLSWNASIKPEQVTQKRDGGRGGRSGNRGVLIQTDRGTMMVTPQGESDKKDCNWGTL